MSTVDVGKLKRFINDNSFSASDEEGFGPMPVIDATVLLEEVESNRLAPVELLPDCVSSVTNCQTCGSRVGVSASKEGTHHYVPLPSPTTGWRPMESAPRDGSKFIGLCGDLVFTCYRTTYNNFEPNGDGSHRISGAYEGWSRIERDAVIPCNPTGWQHLPPTQGEKI